MAQVVIRLTLSTNSLGPYSIYVDSLDNTPVATGITRDELLAGYIIDLPSNIGGTEYTIFIENNQVGCEEIIQRKVTVYDETPLPTVTPTKTPASTPQSTPLPTPSSTPESTPIPTPDSTPQGTPISTPDSTPQSTPITTSTPTPTPTGYIETTSALLLIEPQNTSEDVMSYILNKGISFPDFFGFSFTYLPTTTDSLKHYMEMFATGDVSGLFWYEVQVPQTGPNQYLFDEIIVPGGTVNEKAWYTFFIPEDSIGGSANRMTQLYQGTTSNYEFIVDLESTLYNFGPIYYDGPVFANKNYRVYSSWNDPALRLENENDDLYFKGKKIN